MHPVGELIPFPAQSPMRVPAFGRVVSLYPDGQQVWRHRLYRMPSPPDDESIIYDAGARTLRENSVGGRIDIYA
jgi:hypothetical protein